MGDVKMRAVLLMVLATVGALIGVLIDYLEGKAGGLFMFVSLVAFVAAGWVLLCADEES